LTRLGQQSQGSLEPDLRSARSSSKLDHKVTVKLQGMQEVRFINALRRLVDLCANINVAVYVLANKDDRIAAADWYNTRYS
jgi:hypothetical protein